MQSLLLDEPRERQSDFKLPSIARKQVIQAESVIYGRIILAFHEAHAIQMKPTRRVSRRSLKIQ